MIQIEEQLVVPRPLAEVFDFVADFANIAEWDPGVVASSRRDPAKAMQVGDVIDVTVRFVGRTLPMVYTLVELEPNHRAVWRGEGSTATAVDAIEFAYVPGDETRIIWRAELAMRGPLAFAEPLVRPLFKQLGRATVGGLRRALGPAAGPRR